MDFLALSEVEGLIGVLGRIVLKIEIPSSLSSWGVLFFSSHPNAHTNPNPFSGSQVQALQGPPLRTEYEVRGTEKL